MGLCYLLVALKTVILSQIVEIQLGDMNYARHSSHSNRCSVHGSWYQSCYFRVKAFHVTVAHHAFSSFGLEEIFLGLAFQGKWATRTYSPYPRDPRAQTHVSRKEEAP